MYSATLRFVVFVIISRESSGIIVLIVELWVHERGGLRSRLVVQVEIETSNIYRIPELYFEKCLVPSLVGS